MNEGIIGLDIQKILADITEEVSQYVEMSTLFTVSTAYVDALTIVHEAFAEIFDAGPLDLPESVRILRRLTNSNTNMWSYDDVWRIVKRFGESCQDKMEHRRASGYLDEAYAYADVVEHLVFKIFGSHGYDSGGKDGAQELALYREAFDE